jgi:hypothetical protein
MSFEDEFEITIPDDGRREDPDRRQRDEVHHQAEAVLKG